ncbi:MAG: hypothetical protein P9M05_11600 [Candidatus Stygibacter australis]|nr:hypothetical protein [Candidatus Stygibacter australis]
MKKISYFIKLLVILVILCGCSEKQLQRDEATKLIQSLYPENLTSNIEIFTDMQGKSYDYEFNGHYKKAQKYQDLGIIDLEVKTAMANNTTYFFCYASLTSIAKEAILETHVKKILNKTLTGEYDYGYNEYKVKYGTYEFVRITSIFQNDNSKIAEIEYTVEYRSTIFNELVAPRSIVDGRQYTKKINAKNYDNGWKIEK